MLPQRPLALLKLSRSVTAGTCFAT